MNDLAEVEVNFESILVNRVNFYQFQVNLESILIINVKFQSILNLLCINLIKFESISNEFEPIMKDLAEVEVDFGYSDEILVNSDRKNVKMKTLHRCQ